MNESVTTSNADSAQLSLLDDLRTSIATRAQREQNSGRHFNRLFDTTKDAGLTRIATGLSKDVGIVPRSLSDIDPRLDPENESFDFSFWASTFLRLIREDVVSRTTQGVTFSSLTVSGTGSDVELQKTVTSPLIALARLPMTIFQKRKPQHKVILNGFNGSIERGEMLLILGRPGSGCTTLLKTLACQSQGLELSPESSVLYDGIAQSTFAKHFKGRAVYSAEDDEHFPHLTVKQTLQFAVAARTPHTRIKGVDRKSYGTHMVEVMLRIFGLLNARHTKVGNDVIRGVSGGERKRVSIAEMAMTRASIAVWDNPTRGSSNLPGSQSLYETFDKVTVLYAGRQIYFGPVEEARSYFERMGWQSPPRQTTPDFLTAVTNPTERRWRDGFATSIPKTPLDFEKYWLASAEFKKCMADINRDRLGNQGAEREEALRKDHHSTQAHHTRDKSPFIISVPMQVGLCMRRASQLFWNDLASTITLIAGRVILAFVVGSIYYGPNGTTSSLGSRGSVLFLATLMNALLAVTEISSLFSRRGIIAKQQNYAFYHPFADALATYIVDIPVKLVIAALFNLVFYFMTGLRTEASNFFIFLLFNFICTLLMSALFRTIGAACKAMAPAYAIAGIGILAQIMYTGFTLQTSCMHPWFRWIAYINPVAYIFESLLVNEVHGQEYPCAAAIIVPPYAGNTNFACAFIGATANSRTVSGDEWVASGYGYDYAHMWRNLGIAVSYLVAFLALYLAATEARSTAGTLPQRLIFRTMKAARDSVQMSAAPAREASEDLDTAGMPPEKVPIATMTTDVSSDHCHPNGRSDRGTLVWRDVTLNINIRGTPRRLLDNVTGWVTPGTMTCLMGVSGAGKTTLLDVLAQRRNTTGKLTGSILVDNSPLKPSYRHKTGYVQQQDLHLPTTTVREALQFSAKLRLPSSTPLQDKDAFVQSVLELLHMESFSDAVIGLPGEGLNLEQRKLLTIGVELVAKPPILFLDEPTSGLDSQSAWNIVTLLQKLASDGQAILATIHQPSATIFEQFDSVLLLSKGGRTAYFGPLGPDCRTLTGHFESQGARSCGKDENPAEYILDVMSDTKHDWPALWKASPTTVFSDKEVAVDDSEQRIHSTNVDDEREYATSFLTQLTTVLRRQFECYWRSPEYIYAKFQANLLAALFIGFTFFLQDSSATGLQNTVFSIFMLNATFSTVANQIMSRFMPQRSLFEVRESPSRMYSWSVFLLANIIVEIPYQIALSVVVWACYYFPVFGYHASPHSQAMMYAFVLQFLLFASTYAQMIVFTMPSLETAGAISTLLFTITLQFNGVLQPPSALPGFWIFMWRVSPFTYLIGGWAGTGLVDRVVKCAQNELAVFDPPEGQTCGVYLQKYMQAGAPGALYNPQATQACQYCPIRNANQFLAGASIYPSDQYRNFGILWGYIAFNVLAAVSLYYLFRVRGLSLRALVTRKGASAEQVQPEANKETTRSHAQPIRRWSKLGFYCYLSWSILRNVVKSDYAV
ncbi:Multidrug resistance protein CDR1 [Cyphellophora attinorum]|uniref:Multidrug resistance protein CDR1 n=1 Tax=Cyphellophora attinorum TaxID=1664694 RepID=A0A0N1HJZ8_9EURO|nr:Multidrug resistance protein CDR1 [Phialophora attinorum]KPI34416.1 Multidrug resistance protein CDR1 [Phialophora attinorum]